MKLEGQITHKEFHAKLLAEKPGYKEAYEALEPEFAIFGAILEARIKKNLTQKQLAKKLGVAQSALARFESGRGNPTFAWMTKVSQALGLKIKVEPA